MPGSKSAFYDKNREKPNISLFTISKRADLRKKWLNVLKYVRSNRGAYSFDVKKPKQKNICVRVPFQE